jgi:lipopolysaccharide/colanic/teichoic acid biosynthesis glycosyltransferase
MREERPALVTTLFVARPSHRQKAKLTVHVAMGAWLGQSTNCGGQMNLEHSRSQRLPRPGYGRAKRAFDLTLAVMGLIVAGPIMALLAVLVAIFLGRPVIFKQVRPGQGGRSFTMYKFRTMTDARDRYGKLLPDHERLSRFGRVLRASSLDELPELWNVLLGDMSIVGPRPLLQEYLPLYSERQARRHEVRPGLTGWSQVTGRNALSWEEKLERDVWYVEHASFWLDCRILALTIATVLTTRGVSQPGHSTAERFRGSQQ